MSLRGLSDRRVYFINLQSAVNNLGNLKRFDLLRLVRDVLTGSVMPPYYFIVVVVEPLLKLGVLATVDLLACFWIIYLLQKVLPKNYSQYILGI